MGLRGRGVLGLYQQPRAWVPEGGETLGLTKGVGLELKFPYKPRILKGLL